MADDTAPMTPTAMQPASQPLRVKSGRVKSGRVKSGRVKSGRDKSGRDKFGHAKAAERRARVAAELRVNLQRRKAKQRAEAQAGEDHPLSEPTA